MAQSDGNQGGPFLSADPSVQPREALQVPEDSADGFMLVFLRRVVVFRVESFGMQDSKSSF